MPRIGTVVRDVYWRPGADAVPAHLECLYGISVDKATRLAPGAYRVDRRDGPAWQCWLAVVCATVNRAHVPDGRKIAALAASAQAAARGLQAH
ncbi:MAG TPA: hypothetical protein VMA72_30055 [Streptosporangiaceae bacterium]|nr:hypothetical protein [Streptosporangiaceae bacterium]